MKKAITILIVVLFLITNIKAQTLTINNVPYGLEIIEGTNFDFPDTLQKCQITVTKTGSDYVLKGEKSVDNSTEVTNGNNTVTIHNSSNVRNTKFSQTNNGVKTKTSCNNTTPRLKIIIPAGVNLVIDVMSDVNITASLNTLQLKCSGENDVVITKVNDIDIMNILGDNDIIIKECKAINILNVSGTSNVTINQCEFINILNASGASNVNIAKNARIELQMMSGNSDVKRF